MISVTLGNIVGGGIFVGVLYFYAHVCGTEVCKGSEAAEKEPAAHAAP